MLDPEKDHYKPVRTVSAFNNIYIQYESIGDKDKNLLIKKKYIYIYNTYLRTFIYMYIRMNYIIYI